MHAKSLIVGLALGIGLYAALDQLYISDEMTNVAIIESKVDGPDIGENVRPTELFDLEGVETIEELPGNGLIDIAPGGSQGAASSKQHWTEQQQSILDTEPRDDAWSYFAEQSIIQFLGSHPLGSEFDVEYVECRSTICQLKVTGFDASTGPSWQRIMFDLRQEPWAEFGQHGNTWGDVEGGFVIIETMYRDQSPN